MILTVHPFVFPAAIVWKPVGYEELSVGLHNLWQADVDEALSEVVCVYIYILFWEHHGCFYSQLCVYWITQ